MVKAKVEVRDNKFSLLDELKSFNLGILTIFPSSEDIIRHREVADYITKVQEAHEQTKYSTLKFGYKSCA